MDNSTHARLVGQVGLIILASLVLLAILGIHFGLVFLEFCSICPPLSLSEAIVILANQVSLPSLAMPAIRARNPKLATLGNSVGMGRPPLAQP